MPLIKKAVELARNASSDYATALDMERAGMYREALDMFKAGEQTNLGAVLRSMFLSDPALFEEVAELQKRSGNPYLMQWYKKMSKPTIQTISGGLRSTLELVEMMSDENRASEITATAGAGDNDLGALFVENSIKKQLEAESPLLGQFDGRRIPTGTKSYKFPKSSNRAKAAFATVSANLTDLTNTVDVGLGQTAGETQKFGGYMFFEGEVFVKLTAQTISQLIDELYIAYRRGMVDQAVNGDGNSPNALGFATNATSVAYAGNAAATIVKMIAAVADTTRGGMNDIFILTNTAGKTALVGEKFINPAFNDLLDVVSGNEFVKSLKIIEENAIVSSGTTPNVTAPLYVGKKGDYLFVTQQDPTIMVDYYGDFKAAGQNVRILGFWDGRPHFNDSFAKTTLPSLY